MSTVQNYLGCCGSCEFCQLNEGQKSGYNVFFKCTEEAWGNRHKADDRACSKFRPAKGRTNEAIQRYVDSY